MQRDDELNRGALRRGPRTTRPMGGRFCAHIEPGAGLCFAKAQAEKEIK